MKSTIAVLALLCLAGGIFAADSGAPDAVARGERLYQTLCWTCHGKYGRGDGPAVEGLVMRPPDLTVPSILRERSDDEIIGRLTPSDEGAHTPMVMAQILREDALLDALAYMRTLSVPGKRVSVYAGKDVYNSFCWVCHGMNGDGQGPAAPHIGETKPRDFTSPQFTIAGREDEVYRVIFEGAAEAIHGSTYMLDWGTRLSPQQIRDVTAYIATFKGRKP